MNWLNKYSIDIQRDYSALKKLGHIAICNYIHKPEGHYAKRNKPITEGQILHESTCIMYLAIVKLLESENRMVVARG